jgi:hypothetical protein
MGRSLRKSTVWATGSGGGCALHPGTVPEVETRDEELDWGAGARFHGYRAEPGFGPKGVTGPWPTGEAGWVEHQIEDGAALFFPGLVDEEER